MSSVRKLLTVEIRNEQDVVLARQRARQIAELLGFDLQAQTKIGTAISEIVRNAFRYAGGGKATFQFEEDDHRRLVIQVSDSGPGIGDLESILSGTYVSKTGMGRGLIGTRRIMDRFTLVSQPGQGTVVTVTKFLSPRAPAITPEAMTRIVATLSAGLPGDPVGEVQQQNQELMRVLDELQQRQVELITVNRELEDTNRGVVALYAELDARADFLRKSTEVKSKFLSNMTHEFRTPLNSIIALSSMLIARSDGELNSEQDKQVGFILRSAETLAALVDDLLDIAKVDAGKVAIKPTAFTMESLFGALKGMLKPLLSNHSNVTLDFDEPPADVPILSTDEGKVSQILRNLISNALKFTQRGQVRVSVSSGGVGRIRISVSDTGCGIAAENLGRIFEEFGQIDSDAPKAFKGTGLGLPLSKRLAELLGGTLEAVSESGKGSVFSLDIPIHYAGIGEGAIAIATRGSASEAFKRQALIIDDDDVSRYLLRGILPSVFEVVEASSGRQGIDMAGLLKPDVIFLDLLMPRMSGFEVLSTLRRDPAMAGVRIVIYSAHTMDEAVSARLAGADAILLVSGKNAISARDAMLRALREIDLIPEVAGATENRDA